MLAYYFDRNIARAVKVGLRRRNIEVIDTDDDGTGLFEDEALLKRAASLHRVLFTHDADFLSISVRWNRGGHDHGGIVYVHIHRMSIGELVLDLERLALQYAPAQIANTVLYLPWHE